MQKSRAQFVIIGAGGHAMVVADAVRLLNHDVIGFVDTISKARKGETFYGSKVLGGIAELDAMQKNESFCVALGFGDCQARYHILHFLREHNFEIVSVIHPKAIISKSACIGAGCYIGPGAIIEANCNIAAGTIINCGVCVCHQGLIGEAATLCPGAMIGGNVQIGERTWIGIGTTVVEKIVIGNDCYIGAGATVVKNLPPGVLAYGVPAKIIKAIEVSLKADQVMG